MKPYWLFLFNLESGHALNMQPGITYGFLGWKSHIIAEKYSSEFRDIIINRRGRTISVYMLVEE